MAERRSDGRYLWSAVLISAVLAELGHQLGFVERYGARGFALEAVGVHQYFPTLMSVVGAGLGGAALAVLLVLSLGRLALGGALGRTPHLAIPVGRLLPLLLALQLAVYLTQETSEALASGQLVTARSRPSGEPRSRTEPSCPRLSIDPRQATVRTAPRSFRSSATATGH
jgi:uncharacterized oligopeptide transporter (OPT) family protein